MDTVITLIIAAMVFFAGICMIACDNNDTDDKDDDQDDNEEVADDDDDDDNDDDDQPPTITQEAPLSCTSHELCVEIVDTGLVPSLPTVGDCLWLLDVEFSAVCVNYKAFLHCSCDTLDQPGSDFDFITAIEDCTNSYCL